MAMAMVSWKVWADEDELQIELRDGERHVLISIEKTQDQVQFGYAVKRGGMFKPARYDLDSAGMIADDINDAI